MTIELKSGSPLTVDSLRELQRDVSGPLNGQLSGSNLERSSVGPDQLYDGALRRAVNQEALGSTIVEHHIIYPETIKGPYWNRPIDWHPDSHGYSSISHNMRQSQENADERRTWDLCSPYSSNGSHSATTPYREFFYTSGAFRMYELNPTDKGCSVFFYLNARIATTYMHAKMLEGKVHPPYMLGPARAGDRGWLAPVFYFKYSPSAPMLKWSPCSVLGGFANEFNGAWRDQRRFQDVEQIFSVSETFFISKETLQILAWYHGYYPYNDFNMGTNQEFNPLFGWELRAGRDRFDHRWDEDNIGELPPKTDKDGYANGLPFSVKNGNVGFMSLDYMAPEKGWAKGERYEWIKNDQFSGERS